MQRYDLPRGYVYLEAKFSPQGNYIVMMRVPLWNENEERRRAAYENSGIVLMKADGKDFHVLPLVPGPKTEPTMSNGEDKIAYWRGQLREPNSKTFAAKFALWEIDLKSKEDKIFAGQFQFYQVNQMLYMPTDKEILAGAYGPLSDTRGGGYIGDYLKKYNGSEIYRFSRGQSTLSEPLYSQKVEGIKMPVMDQLGYVYYKGGLPGLHLFKAKDVSVPLQQWVQPLAFNYIRDLVVSPQGDLLMFIYTLQGYDYQDSNSSGIGQLDTTHGIWQKIIIPEIATVEEIVIA